MNTVTVIFSINLPVPSPSCLVNLSHQERCFKQPQQLAVFHDFIKYLVTFALLKALALQLSNIMGAWFSIQQKSVDTAFECERKALASINSILKKQKVNENQKETDRQRKRERERERERDSFRSFDFKLNSIFSEPTTVFQYLPFVLLQYLTKNALV